MEKIEFIKYYSYCEAACLAKSICETKKHTVKIIYAQNESEEKFDAVDVSIMYKFCKSVLYFNSYGTSMTAKKMA